MIVRSLLLAFAISMSAPLAATYQHRPHQEILLTYTVPTRLDMAYILDNNLIKLSAPRNQIYDISRTNPWYDWMGDATTGHWVNAKEANVAQMGLDENLHPYLDPNNVGERGQQLGDRWGKFLYRNPDGTLSYDIGSPAMSEEEIQIAIRNRNARKSKRVIAEMSRLVDEYIANFKAYVAQNGTAPFLLEVQVRCPIERMVVRLMMAALEADKTLVRNNSTLH